MMPFVKLALQIIQIGAAILLTLAILMQAKGAGVGTIFGGEGQFYKSRRGVEKLLMIATIFLSLIFAATSILNLII